MISILTHFADNILDIFYFFCIFEKSLFFYFMGTTVPLAPVEDVARVEAGKHAEGVEGGGKTFATDALLGEDHDVAGHALATRVDIRHEVGGALRLIHPGAEGVSGLPESMPLERDLPTLAKRLVTLEGGNSAHAPLRAPDSEAASIVRRLAHLLLAPNDPIYGDLALRFLPARCFQELIGYGRLIHGGIGRKAAQLMIAQYALSCPDPEFDESFFNRYPRFRGTAVQENGPASFFERNKFSAPVGMGVFNTIITENPELADVTQKLLNLYTPSDDEISSEAGEDKEPQFSEEAGEDKATEPKEEVFRKAHQAVSDAWMEAKIPEAIIDELRALFRKFFDKKQPLIVRSSSLLEDGGVASFADESEREAPSFAGRYESIPFGLSGNLDADFARFLTALRTVYASTFSSKALEYRKDLGLIGYREAMAVLVQTLNGEFRGEDRARFYPLLSGFARAYAPQPFGHDPRAGDVRMCCGLGVAVADGKECPTLPLSKPDITFDSGNGSFQNKVFLIDRKSGNVESAHPVTLHQKDDEGLHQIVTRVAGDFGQQYFVCDFKAARAHSSLLPALIWYIVHKLSRQLTIPAQVEFTASHQPPDDTYRCSLVQWRPLNMPEHASPSRIPECVPESDVIGRYPSLGTNICLAGVTHVLYIPTEIFVNGDLAVIALLPRYIEAINRLLSERPGMRCLFLVGRRFGSEGASRESDRFGNSSGISVSPGQFDQALSIIECCDGNSEPSYGAHDLQALDDRGLVFGAMRCPEDGLPFFQEARHTGEVPPIDKLVNDPTISPELLARVCSAFRVVDIAAEYKRLRGQAGDDRPRVLHVAADAGLESSQGHGVIGFYFAPQGKMLPEKTPI